MVRVLVAAVVLSVILLACAPVPLVDGNGTRPTVTTPPDGGRPDIPRTNPPGTDPEPVFEDPGEQPRGTPRDFLNTVGNNASSPHVGLDVPLNEPIGRYYPIVTANELTFLRHPAMVLDGGDTLTYHEEIMFDFGPKNSTGKVVFAKDPYNDEIGSYLFFEERKPILEYRLVLDRGNFVDLQGREIQVLGNKYVIADVSGKTVNLYGRDIASNIAFTNGSKLYVNNSYRQHTEVRVWPSAVAFRIIATDEDEDGILLSPGESLVDNLGWERFASRLLDVRYLGTPNQSASLVKLDRKKYGYEMTVDVAGGRVQLPLVEEDAGRLVLGSPDGGLRITPCPANQRFCIAPGTQLLLTSPRGRSFLVEYVDATNGSKELIMRSSGNRYSFEFLGEPGRDAWTDIVLDGEPFRAHIGPKDNRTGDYNISVEQGFRQGRSEIVTADGSIVRILDMKDGNRTLPLEIIMPAFRAQRGEDKVSLNITLSGIGSDDDSWRIVAGGNITFEEVEDDEDDVGMSRYGIGIFLDKKDRDLPTGVGEEATVLLPWGEAFGVVAVEG